MTVLAGFAAMVACDPDEGFQERASAVSVEQPVASAGNIGCTIADREQGLRIKPSRDGYRATLSPRDEIVLVTENDRNVHGDVEIEYMWHTQFGSHRGILPLRSFAASTNGEIRIGVAELSLPSRALEFSGDLFLVPAASFAGRAERLDVTPISLHFHPVGSQWEVYDELSRRNDFDEGALSNALSLERDALVTHLDLPDEVRFTANAVGQKISDDPTFVPPDMPGN